MGRGALPRAPRYFFASVFPRLFHSCPKFLVLELVGAMLKAVADDSLSFRYTQQLLRGAVTALPVAGQKVNLSVSCPWRKIVNKLEKRESDPPPP
jgi:hypothetical protein